MTVLLGIASVVLCFGGFGFWLSRDRVVIAVVCLLIGGVGYGIALEHAHGGSTFPQTEVCE